MHSYLRLGRCSSCASWCTLTVIHLCTIACLGGCNCHTPWTIWERWDWSGLTSNWRKVWMEVNSSPNWYLLTNLYPTMVSWLNLSNNSASALTDLITDELTFLSMIYWMILDLVNRFIPIAGWVTYLQCHFLSCLPVDSVHNKSKTPIP